MTRPPRPTEHIRQAGEIYVFASSQQGETSGAGMARQLFKADPEVREGLTGDAYALPLFVTPGMVRSRLAIHEVAQRLVAIAQWNPELRFFLPRIGVGSTGYVDADIAPCFKGIPETVRIPPEWEIYLRRAQPVAAATTDPRD